MIVSACRSRVRRSSFWRSSSAIRARSMECGAGFGPRPPRCERVEQAPVALGAPAAERGGVPPLTAQVGLDLSGLPQLVRFPRGPGACRPR